MKGPFSFATLSLLTLVGLFACDQRGSSGSSKPNVSSRLDGSPAADGSSDARGFSATTYLCAAYAQSSSADSGRVGAAIEQPQCTVGETYCYVQLPHSGSPGTPSPSCKGYSDSLSLCSANPSCDCLCSHWYHCQTECRCSEANGFATVSCEQI